MEQAIIQEVVSIRNRLGTIIMAAGPKLNKEWIMFERIVAAHKNLRGIEIDKSTNMSEAPAGQAPLPGMPDIQDNICPTCSLFESCEFEVKNKGGVKDCDSYQLKSSESDSSESQEEETSRKLGEEFSQEDKGKRGRKKKEQPPTDYEDDESP